MSLPQVELKLIPEPGKKPEFIAVLEPRPMPNGKPPPLWNQVVASPDQQSARTVILEGYTRDAWAESSSSKVWMTYHVQSKDGRQKLPGFINFLRERNKSAYGRLLKVSAKTSPSTYVLVISKHQTSNTIISCRVAPISSIDGCPLKPLHQHSMKPPPPVVPSAAAGGPTKSIPTLKAPPPTTAASAMPPPPYQSKRKGLGLLGNLTAKKQRTDASMGGGGNRSGQTGRPMTAAAAAAGGFADGRQTFGEIISEFRKEMESKMKKFQDSSDLITRVSLKTTDYTKNARTQSDAARITMDMLRYVVNEAVEETDETWICHKEPSEFTDECVLCIYKREEDVPEDVLEDYNRVEVPEDAKIEQHKIQEARRQQELKAEQIRERLQEEKLRNAAKKTG